MPNRKVLGTRFVRFENPDDSFTGTLTEKTTQVIRGIDVGRYLFEHDGTRYSLNGSTQLDDMMADAEVGDLIEIIYTGERPTTNGFTVKEFTAEVLIDAEEQG